MILALIPLLVATSLTLVGVDQAEAQSIDESQQVDRAPVAHATAEGNGVRGESADVLCWRFDDGAGFAYGRAAAVLRAEAGADESAVLSVVDAVGWSAGLSVPESLEDVYFHPAFPGYILNGGAPGVAGYDSFSETAGVGALLFAPQGHPFCGNVNGFNSATAISPFDADVCYSASVDTLLARGLVDIEGAFAIWHWVSAGDVADWPAELDPVPAGQLVCGQEMGRNLSILLPSSLYVDVEADGDDGGSGLGPWPQYFDFLPDDGVVTCAEVWESDWQFLNTSIPAGQPNAAQLAWVLDGMETNSSCYQAWQRWINFGDCAGMTALVNQGNSSPWLRADWIQTCWGFTPYDVDNDGSAACAELQSAFDANEPLSSFQLDALQECNWTPASISNETFNQIAACVSNVTGSPATEYHFGLTSQTGNEAAFGAVVETYVALIAQTHDWFADPHINRNELGRMLEFEFEQSHSADVALSDQFGRYASLYEILDGAGLDDAVVGLDSVVDQWEFLNDLCAAVDYVEQRFHWAFASEWWFWLVEDPAPACTAFYDAFAPGTSASAGAEFKTQLIGAVDDAYGASPGERVQGWVALGDVLRGPWDIIADQNLIDGFVDTPVYLGSLVQTWLDENPSADQQRYEQMESLRDRTAGWGSALGTAENRFTYWTVTGDGVTAANFICELAVISAAGTVLASLEQLTPCVSADLQDGVDLTSEPALQQLAEQIYAEMAESFAGFGQVRFSSTNAVGDQVDVLGDLLASYEADPDASPPPAFADFTASYSAVLFLAQIFGGTNAAETFAAIMTSGTQGGSQLLSQLAAYCETRQLFLAINAHFRPEFDGQSGGTVGIFTTMPACTALNVELAPAERLELSNSAFAAFALNQNIVDISPSEGWEQTREQFTQIMLDDLVNLINGYDGDTQTLLAAAETYIADSGNAGGVEVLYLLTLIDQGQTMQQGFLNHPAQLMIPMTNFMCEIARHQSADAMTECAVRHGMPGIDPTLSGQDLYVAILEAFEYLAEGAAGSPSSIFHPLDQLVSAGALSDVEISPAWQASLDHVTSNPANYELLRIWVGDVIDTGAVATVSVELAHVCNLLDMFKAVFADYQQKWSEAFTNPDYPILAHCIGLTGLDISQVTELLNASNDFMSGMPAQLPGIWLEIQTAQTTLFNELSDIVTGFDNTLDTLNEVNDSWLADGNPDPNASFATVQNALNATEFDTLDQWANTTLPNQHGPLAIDNLCAIAAPGYPTTDWAPLVGAFQGHEASPGSGLAVCSGLDDVQALTAAVATIAANDLTESMLEPDGLDAFVAEASALLDSFSDSDVLSDLGFDGSPGSLLAVVEAYRADNEGAFPTSWAGAVDAAVSWLDAAEDHGVSSLSSFVEDLRADSLPDEWELFANTVSLINVVCALSADDQVAAPTWVGWTHTEFVENSQLKEASCAAVLVDEDWMLTAAHCLDPNWVRVGGVAPHRGSRLKAAEVFRHPWWAGTIGSGGQPQLFDVALIRLANSASAASLPIDLEDITAPWLAAPAPDAVTLYGYAHPFGSTPVQGRLNVRTSPNNEHLSSVVSSSRLELLSADIVASPICRGDSGGPVTKIEDGSERLTAVIWSIQTSPNGCNTIASSTRVSTPTVREWIRSVTHDTYGVTGWDSISFHTLTSDLALGPILDFDSPNGAPDLKAIYPWTASQEDGWLSDLVNWSVTVERLDIASVPEVTDTEIFDTAAPAVAGCTGHITLNEVEASSILIDGSLVDPPGIWVCDGGLDNVDPKRQLVSAAYLINEFDSPVAVDSGSNQLVIRRVEVDVPASENADGTLAELCDWSNQPGLTAAQAAVSCDGVIDDFEIGFVSYRNPGENGGLGETTGKHTVTDAFDAFGATFEMGATFVYRRDTELDPSGLFIDPATADLIAACVNEYGGLGFTYSLSEDGALLTDEALVERLEAGVAALTATHTLDEIAVSDLDEVLAHFLTTDDYVQYNSLGTIDDLIDVYDDVFTPATPGTIAGALGGFDVDAQPEQFGSFVATIVSSCSAFGLFAYPYLLVHNPGFTGASDAFAPCMSLAALSVWPDPEVLPSATVINDGITLWSTGFVGQPGGWQAIAGAVAEFETLLTEWVLEQPNGDASGIGGLPDTGPVPNSAWIFAAGELCQEIEQSTGYDDHPLVACAVIAGDEVFGHDPAAAPYAANVVEFWFDNWVPSLYGSADNADNYDGTAASTVTHFSQVANLTTPGEQNAISAVISASQLGDPAHGDTTLVDLFNGVLNEATVTYVNDDGDTVTHATALVTLGLHCLLFSVSPADCGEEGMMLGAQLAAPRGSRDLGPLNNSSPPATLPSNACDVLAACSAIDGFTVVGDIPSVLNSGEEPAEWGGFVTANFVAWDNALSTRLGQLGLGNAATPGSLPAAHARSFLIWFRSFQASPSQVEWIDAVFAEDHIGLEPAGLSLASVLAGGFAAHGPTGAPAAPVVYGLLCSYIDYKAGAFAGALTPQGDHPWFAAHLDGNGESDCGGTLITPQHVMTARHCLNGPANRWVIGDAPLSTLGQGIPLGIQNKHWSADIAIFELDEPYEGVSAADLPVLGAWQVPAPEAEPANVAIGETVHYFIGRGQGDVLPPTDELHTAVGVLLPPAPTNGWLSDCTDKWLSQCSHTVSGEVCGGDSGGPVLEPWAGDNALVVGVVHSAWNFDAVGARTNTCKMNEYAAHVELTEVACFIHVVTDGQATWLVNGDTQTGLPEDQCEVPTITQAQATSLGACVNTYGNAYSSDAAENLPEFSFENDQGPLTGGPLLSALVEAVSANGLMGQTLKDLTKEALTAIDVDFANNGPFLPEHETLRTQVHELIDWIDLSNGNSASPGVSTIFQRSHALAEMSELLSFVELFCAALAYYDAAYTTFYTPAMDVWAPCQALDVAVTNVADLSDAVFSIGISIDGLRAEPLSQKPSMWQWVADPAIVNLLLMNGGVAADVMSTSLSTLEATYQVSNSVVAPLPGHVPDLAWINATADRCTAILAAINYDPLQACASFDSLNVDVPVPGQDPTPGEWAAFSANFEAWDLGLRVELGGLVWDRTEGQTMRVLQLFHDSNAGEIDKPIIAELLGSHLNDDDTMLHLGVAEPAWMSENGMHVAVAAYSMLCQVAEHRQGMRRGTPATAGHHPWHVTLFATMPDGSDERSFVGCGGIQVTDRHIVTAGHCIDGIVNKWLVEERFDGIDLVWRFGDDLMSAGLDEVSIDGTTMLELVENGVGAPKNDLGIITLNEARPLAADETYPVLADRQSGLASSPPSVNTLESFVSIGRSSDDYDENGNEVESFTDDLRQIAHARIPDTTVPGWTADCTVWDALPQVPTDYPGKSDPPGCNVPLDGYPCAGDSGGAVVDNGYVVGATATIWGSNIAVDFCGGRTNMTYTRLWENRCWIYENTSVDGNPSEVTWLVDGTAQGLPEGECDDVQISDADLELVQECAVWTLSPAPEAETLDDFLDDQDEFTSQLGAALAPVLEFQSIDDVPVSMLEAMYSDYVAAVDLSTPQANSVDEYELLVSQVADPEESLNDVVANPPAGLELENAAGFCHTVQLFGPMWPYYIQIHQDGASAGMHHCAALGASNPQVDAEVALIESANAGFEYWPTGPASWVTLSESFGELLGLLEPLVNEAAVTLDPAAIAEEGEAFLAANPDLSQADEDLLVAMNDFASSASQATQTAYDAWFVVPHRAPNSVLNGLCLIALSQVELIVSPVDGTAIDVGETDDGTGTGSFVISGPISALPDPSLVDVSATVAGASAHAEVVRTWVEGNSYFVDVLVHPAGQPAEAEQFETTVVLSAGVQQDTVNVTIIPPLAGHTILNANSISDLDDIASVSGVELTSSGKLTIAASTEDLQSLAGAGRFAVGAIVVVDLPANGIRIISGEPTFELGVVTVDTEVGELTDRYRQVALVAEEPGAGEWALGDSSDNHPPLALDGMVEGSELAWEWSLTPSVETEVGPWGAPETKLWAMVLDGAIELSGQLRAGEAGEIDFFDGVLLQVDAERSVPAGPLSGMLELEINPTIGMEWDADIEVAGVTHIDLSTRIEYRDGEWYFPHQYNSVGDPMTTMVSSSEFGMIAEDGGEARLFAGLEGSVGYLAWDAVGLEAELELGLEYTTVNAQVFTELDPAETEVIAAPNASVELFDAYNELDLAYGWTLGAYAELSASAVLEVPVLDWEVASLELANGYWAFTPFVAGALSDGPGDLANAVTTDMTGHTAETAIALATECYRRINSAAESPQSGRLFQLSPDGEHWCNELPVYFPGLDLGLNAWELRTEGIDEHPEWAVQARIDPTLSERPAWHVNSTTSPVFAGCLYGQSATRLSEGSPCWVFPNNTMAQGHAPRLEPIEYEPVRDWVSLDKINADHGLLNDFYSQCRRSVADTGPIPSPVPDYMNNPDIVTLDATFLVIPMPAVGAPAPPSGFVCNGTNTLLPVPAGLERHRVVHYGFGDSYGSGEGAGDYGDSGLCHRSENAYTNLVSWATESHLIACSGAKTENLFSTPQRPDDATGNVTQAQEFDSIVNDGPQPVDQYETQIMTLSIGGNDAHFEPVLRDCVVNIDLFNGTCQNNPNLVADVEAAIAVLAGDGPDGLATMYRRLLDETVQPGAASDRVLFVTGFPYLFHSGAHCAGLTWLSAEERQWLDSVGYDLNLAAYEAVQTLQAEGKSVHFVDLTEPFTGHGACAPALERWIHGLAVPVVHSFHPNAAGNVAIANQVAAHVEPYLRGETVPETAPAVPAAMAPSSCSAADGPELSSHLANDDCDTVSLDPADSLLPYYEGTFVVERDVVVIADPTVAARIISDGSGTDEATITVAGSAELTLEGVTVGTSATAETQGGALRIQGGGEAVLLAVAFTNDALSEPVSGGLVYVGPGAKLVARATSFEEGSAVMGGAIFADTGSLVSITGGVFEQNLADVGGAIYAAESSSINLHGDVDSATFNHTTLTSEQAVALVEIQQSLPLGEPRRLLFRGNLASQGEGGALYGESNVRLTGGRVDFLDNVSTGRGGAIRLSDSSAAGAISFATFLNNTSAGPAGGAIYGDEVNLRLLGVFFALNEVSPSDQDGVIEGGAVAFRNSEVDMDLVAFVENELGESAGRRGGAISVVTTAGHPDVFEAFEVICEANTAADGGCLYASGANLTLNAVEAFGHDVSGSGGALYLEGSTTTLYDGNFQSNTATRGGAIANYGRWDTPLANVPAGATSGGGLGDGAPALAPVAGAAAQPGRLEIIGSVMLGNVAAAMPGQFSGGGAVFNYSGGEVIVRHADSAPGVAGTAVVRMAANAGLADDLSTPTWGGGFYNGYGSKLIIREATFAESVAARGGLIANDGDLTIDSSTIEGAADGCPAEAQCARGGAILNRGTAEVSNTTIQDGWATVAGSVLMSEAYNSEDDQLVREQPGGIDGFPAPELLPTMNVIHSTFLQNRNGQAAVIESSAGRISIEASVIANNSTSTMCRVGDYQDLVWPPELLSDNGNVWVVDQVDTPTLTDVSNNCPARQSEDLVGTFEGANLDLEALIHGGNVATIKFDKPSTLWNGALYTEGSTPTGSCADSPIGFNDARHQDRRDQSASRCDVGAFEWQAVDQPWNADFECGSSTAEAIASIRGRQDPPDGEVPVPIQDPDLVFEVDEIVVCLNGFTRDWFDVQTPAVAASCLTDYVESFVAPIYDFAFAGAAEPTNFVLNNPNSVIADCVQLATQCATGASVGCIALARPASDVCMIHSDLAELYNASIECPSWLGGSGAIQVLNADSSPLLIGAVEQVLLEGPNGYQLVDATCTIENLTQGEVAGAAVAYTYDLVAVGANGCQTMPPSCAVPIAQTTSHHDVLDFIWNNYADC